MGQNLVQKIMKAHLVSGNIEPGKMISLSVDQTLMHDATGQMAALEFEALSIPRIKIKLSATYIDHNTLQVGFENADDHHFSSNIFCKVWTSLFTSR